MKKQILMFCVLFGAFQTFAQNFKPVAEKIHNLEMQSNFINASPLFSVSNDKPIPADVVSNAGILNFNSNAAKEMIAAAPENIIFTFPLSSSKNITLKLYRSNFFTPDFSIATSSGDDKFIPEKCLHYWGIINNDYNSIAAISIFNNEVMGMISSPSTGNIILGKINQDQANRHIVYKESDFHINSGPSCSTIETPGDYKSKDLQAPAMSATKCIRLYWEVNYDLFQNKGSIANVTNYVTGIFNQSAILYSNDGIPVSLSQVYVWNTPSPYTGTTTSALLTQFQSNQNSFNGDLGMLIGIAGGGGIAAGTNGLCNLMIDYSQCYAGVSTSFLNVPTYSWSVEVVTHEQGHLMGSKHTHACVWNGNNTAIDACGPTAGYAYEGSCTGAPMPTNGGTIMSYCHMTSAGINFSNGFGPQPKNAILNKFNAASCLTACTAGSTCDVPTGMNTSSITNTTATLSWTAVTGASSYNVQYRVIGSSAWSTVTTTTSSVVLSNLTSSSSYEWQVQTVCSGGSSSFTTSTNFTASSTATCGMPSNVATNSTTATTASLSWTGSAGVNSYTVQYRVVGTSSWSTSSTTSTSIVLNNLTASSTYEFQVRSVCTSGNSAYTASVNFNTNAAGSCGNPANLATTSVTTTTATVVWTGAMNVLSYNIQYRIVGSSAWSTVSTSGTTTVLSNLTPSSNYEYQVQSVCSGGNSVYTSSANFTTSTPFSCGVPGNLTTASVTTSSATLTWTAVSGAVYYNVQYRIVGNSSWITTNTTGTSIVLNSLTTASNYEYELQSVCSGGNSAFSASENFTTTGSATCGLPSALISTSISTTSATLSWTGVSGVTSYNVRYRIVGSSSWITINTTATSIVLNSLIQASNYEFQVQSVCSFGNSAFTSSANFTTATAPTCGLPANLSSSSITTTAATISWTGSSGVTSYNIRYRIVGSSIWSTASSTSASTLLNTLTQSSTYEFQVQSVCSFGNSAFSASANFTTASPATCGIPSNLSTSSVTSTTVTLTWTGLSGIISYNLKYRLVGTSIWTNINTTGSTIILNGLSPASTYEYQVQSVCASGSSAFTSSANFTTPTTPVACGIPSNLSATSVTTTGAVLSWSAISGATTYNIEYRLASSVSWSIVSNLTTTTHSMSGLSSCADYEFRVQSMCSAGVSPYSATSTFTTGGCQPIYCLSRGTNSLSDYISKVSLGTINNTTGSNAGYGDFTALSTTLNGNASYVISLTPGFRTSPFKESWTVYIDYNQNGSFEDAGEKVAHGGGAQMISRMFTVPDDALNGTTRMRVQMKRLTSANGPCHTFTYGEVEDYSVDISGNAQAIQRAPEDGIAVEVSSKLSELNIYPNPATDKITVSIDGNGKDCSIHIVDLNGKLIIQKQELLIEGNNKIEINTDELINGIYFLSVESNGEVKRSKFLVVK
jgi:hypothetical protein